VAAEKLSCLKDEEKRGKRRAVKARENRIHSQVSYVALVSRRGGGGLDCKRKSL